MALAYPDTLPGPALSGSAEGTKSVTSSRVSFDYKYRVIRLPKQLETLSVAFMLTPTELTAFKSWFSSLQASHKFVLTADWFLNGSDNIGKTLRASTVPQLEALGLGKFKVSFNVEILNYGTARAESCPLYPYNTLYPSDTLYPC